MKTKYGIGDVLTIKVRIQRIDIDTEGTIEYELVAVNGTQYNGEILLAERELDKAVENLPQNYDGCKTNWQKEYESLVRTIGSITYGKERWFLQDDGRWYDRFDGKHITIDELHNRICEEVRWLDEN